MCLLTYLRPGAQPNAKHLAAGAVSNRDGHGYAIADGGTLFVRKSLSPGTAISEFVQLREEHPDGPAIFHSRLGTSGLRTTYNVHPFFVGNDKLTVVAHNGILFTPPRSDPRCDTRMFAEGMLPATFGDLDHYRLRTTLENWLGRTNKIAILTVNPEFEDSAYLFNAESGRWIDDGTWHSNSSYLRASDWYPHWLEDLDENTGVLCAVCLKRGHIDPDTMICGNCHYCNECFEPDTACMCSPSERYDRRPGGSGSQLAITAGPSS
jgi:glutamine amidotransferase